MTGVKLSRDLGKLMGYLNGETKSYVLASCSGAQTVDDCPASVRKWLTNPNSIPVDKLSFAAKQARKEIRLSAVPEIVKGVADRLDVARAHARLEILPNPNRPDLKDAEKFVESPWRVIPTPTVDPNLWDDAQVTVVDLNDLYATDPYLKRKNVAKHIDNMGQAITPFRSYALVADVNGRLVIIDGHHRLMALWLLGQETAPVYLVKVI